MEDSLAYIVNNTANISRALRDIANAIGILAVVIAILGTVHFGKDFFWKKMKEEDDK